MITMDDKYRLEDFGLIAEMGHGNPITPKIEHKTLPIPGRTGLWDFGSEVKEKGISIPVACIGKDRINLQQNLNDFVAFLCDEFGKPRELKVVFDYEKDKFYKVKLAGQLDPERIIHLGRFELGLVAHDPYKYSRVTSDEVIWGSEIITFQYNYEFGHEGFSEVTRFQSNSVFNITVGGIAVKPIIEINGKADNLVVEVNGYEIKFSNFKGTDFIIDIEKYSVLKNGKESLQGVEFREFFLLPGINEVKITGKNMDISFFIKHRDKFI